MTDGDSCCIAVAAKNISPVATLSPLLLPLYLETSVFSPSSCISFPARAALSSPFHPLCANQRLFVSCCSLYPAAAAAAGGVR